MRNPYKRLDIFQCRYEAHAKFDYRVSAFHVLKEKNCFPQGCLYFKWRCELFNKGQKCLKGFKHVGKKCFGCRHYDDEKINNQPVLMVTEQEYVQFLDELQEFEEWLDSIRGRTVEFWGTVNSVKPRFTKSVNGENSSINLDGYILHFDDVYLDRFHLEDHCYARIYADQQQRFQFAAGDDVEFQCRVEVNQGRIILTKIRRIEFREKSKNEIWTNSRALVVKATATSFAEQPLKCLHCDKGVLVDVVDKTSSKWERRRELFCLKSYNSPETCTYHVENLLIEIEEECPENEKNND